MASAPTPDDVAAACTATARPLASALATDDGLARRLAEADWPAGVVDEGGQFHRVLVLPGVGAVRIPRTPEAAAHLSDHMATLKILGTTAALPFAVPVPLTEVVGEADGLPAGMAAVVQEYLPGEAHPSHTGEVRWQRAPVGNREGDGTDGDGGDRWALTGILDWDLAAVWDPALNPAYLALWHGEDKLEAIARDADEALRGRVWLGWMALETIYDASLREGSTSDTPPANWPKLLRKVLPRVERATEALCRWQAEHAPATSPRSRRIGISPG
ncbi:hypothetical protein [Citricoccus alkalitolerans]|uniref:Aminoglycoside phosphotransferase domain-containing protein n=1 Tax=Citricoccus alkalitolerans TaxID=246603 RepID=A0ABV8Y173_9MICC